jgi:hypothetical protein
MGRKKDIILTDLEIEMRLTSKRGISQIISPSMHVLTGSKMLLVDELHFGGLGLGVLYTVLMWRATRFRLARVRK